MKWIAMIKLPHFNRKQKLLSIEVRFSSKIAGQVEKLKKKMQ